jgi:hypothetical protein
LTSEVHAPLTGDKYGRNIYLAGSVKLTIHDMLGREATTLVDEKKETGKYVVRFDGSGLASGTYVCCLTAGDVVETKRMTLVK